MGRPVPRAPQTADEARRLVVLAMREQSMGILDEERMQQLAPIARAAVRARGLPPWERDFLDALADLFGARTEEEALEAERKLGEAMRGIE